MNSDQITGIIRAVATPLLAMLIAKGVIPSGNYDVEIVAFATLVTGIWSVHSNRPSKVSK